MDRIVASAGVRGIRIILDYHRLVAGGASEAGFWYDNAAGRTEEQWMTNWETLARRYRNDPTVVGADLFNEVHGPGLIWAADGEDPERNWRWAAKRCANRILAIHPDWLITVQGMPSYGGVGGWWGEVHSGVRDHPLDLVIPNRVVYQVHDYGPVVYDQPFHQPSSGFPANLTSFWDQVFGFLVDQGIGPVWVGEWGSFLKQAEIEAHGREVEQKEGRQPGELRYTDRGNRELQGWFPAFQGYIKSKGLSWTWWTWTPESADTGGIIAPGYTVNRAKAAQLDAVKYPGFAASRQPTPS
jgi:aryl-phospho-beta-D-glucosidase BglC (GH1 family)